MHGAQYVAEIRSTGADANGWLLFEGTGRACVVCPCGTVTGFVDKKEALQAYKDHGAGRPLAEPALLGREEEMAGTAHQDSPRTTVHVDMGAAKGGHVMRDLIQRITRG